MGGGVSKVLVQQYEFACDATVKKYLEALQLTHRQGLLFYQLFAQIDRDHSNSVDLREVYSHFNIERSVFTDIALGVFKGGDGGGDREVRFHDFFVAIWNYCTVTNRQLKMMIFSVFDDSGDGTLEKAEFDALVRMLFNVDQLDGRLKDIIEEADKDGSGSLSFDEFCAITDKHPEVLDPAFKLQKTFLLCCLTPEQWEVEKQKRATLWSDKSIEEIIAKAVKRKEKEKEKAEQRKSKDENERKNRVALREETKRKRQEEEEEKKVLLWVTEHQEPELLTYRKAIEELAEANYVYNRALKGGEEEVERSQQPPSSSSLNSNNNQQELEQEQQKEKSAEEVGRETRRREQVNLDMLQLKVAVTLRQNAVDLALKVLETKWKEGEEKEVPKVREEAADKALMAISADESLAKSLESEAKKMIWTYKNVMKRPPPTWDEALEMVEEEFCEKKATEAEKKCRDKWRDCRQYLEKDVNRIRKTVVERHRKKEEEDRKAEEDKRKKQEEEERKKAQEAVLIASAASEETGDQGSTTEKHLQQGALLTTAFIPPPPPPYVRPPAGDVPSEVEPYRDQEGRLWLKRKDPPSSRFYFHCPHSGQQQWEMPEGLAPATDIGRVTEIIEEQGLRGSSETIRETAEAESDKGV